MGFRMESMTDKVPDTAETWFLEGNRHLAAGDVASAERCYLKALALDPCLAEALANMGWLRDQAGACTAAEIYYRHALDFQPANAEIHLNLAALLMRCQRFDEAEVINRQALQLAPESPLAWSNLGVLLAQMQREDEAERALRAALRADSLYARARFNLGCLLLRQGRFEEGWYCFEARDWYLILENHFTCPRWQGEELAGKSIVIGFEAGHGDMIQFCRYAHVLKMRGTARVDIICHPALKTLFGTLTGVDTVYSFNDDVPVSNWDFWTPPLSLPYHCGTRLETIPASIPYLMPDPERLRHWSCRLPASCCLVGLAWKGNPRFDNDATHSLAGLAQLAPLAGLTGITFVSLQKGAGEEEAQHAPPGMHLLNLGSHLQDFADTAAVVASLDLVISVDTAVAHLAGSIGTPCWVLLPDQQTDWRWLIGRSDTPWYPDGMRLFRQQPGANWPTVVLDVVKALTVWQQER